MIDFESDDTLSERCTAMVEAFRICGPGDVIELHTGIGQLAEGGGTERAVGIGIHGQIFPFRLSEAHRVVKLMRDAWGETCRKNGPSENVPELMLAMEEVIAECGKEMN